MTFKECFSINKIFEKKKLMLSIDKAVLLTEKEQSYAQNKWKNDCWLKLFRYEVINYIILRRRAPSLRERTPLPKGSPNSYYRIHFVQNSQLKLMLFWITNQNCSASNSELKQQNCIIRNNKFKFIMSINNIIFYNKFDIFNSVCKINNTNRKNNEKQFDY